VKRWLVALLGVTSLACGGADGPAPVPQPGVVELPGGGKRVTLTANYLADLNGEGWDLTNGRITPDPTGSAFYLRVTMVVALVPTASGDAFCVQRPAAGAPAFARVEDVPDEAPSCTTYVSAQLGGTLEHSDSQYAGQGYLLRDAAGAGTAKLLTVSDHVTGGDVGVTFDILGL